MTWNSNNGTGKEGAQNVDCDLLLFLWRWKLLSTAALSARFFSKLKPHSAYKRIQKLRRKSLITAVSDAHGEKFLWSLTRKGFQSITSFLPLLREEGFKSENPEHDFLVSAVHLGDTLFDHASGQDIFSEQELRRVHPDFFPSWVPSSAVHRPDGYWRFGGDSSREAIALEVELSPKKDCDYHAVSKFYGRCLGVRRVVWVCGSETLARRVHSRLLEPEKGAKDQHSFFLVSDFEKLGWGALCKFGFACGENLRSIIGRGVGGEWAELPAKIFCDRRKWQTTFKAYHNTLCSQNSRLTPP